MRLRLARRTLQWTTETLAAHCRWPWPSGLRPAERLATALVAGITFVVCFYVLLDLAALFGQGGRVSLFFPIAALCLVFGYLLGPAYLAAPILAVLLAESWQTTALTALPPDSWHIVRQALLYGAAGSLLRQLWQQPPYGVTRRLGILMAVATGAVLANLAVALGLFVHAGWLAPADIPTVALVFFLGDLSGLLLVAPPVLLLLDGLLERRAGRPWPGPASPRDWLTVLALLAAATACIVCALIAFREEDSLPAALAPALLPILAGAMLFGYGVGIGLFSLAAVPLLAVSALLADPPSALALQTMIIVCGIATLAVGAATSDRVGLIARLDASVAARTRQLDAKNAKLVAANAALATAAATDHLTGLPNRRAFDRLFQARLADGRGELGLLLIDIDRFKLINDRHGHQTGDAALVHVARLLAAGVRGGDLVARVGGEEFAVLCQALDEPQLRDLADRLRRTVRSAPLRPDEADELLELRISIGGVLARPADDPDNLLRAADRALYAAKRAGRDRTRISEAPDGLPIAQGTA